LGEILNDFLEVPTGFEPGMEVLQTSALPLGHGTECAVSVIYPTSSAGFNRLVQEMARTHLDTLRESLPFPGRQRWLANEFRLNIQ
jgi:hypothetical protein